MTTTDADEVAVGGRLPIDRIVEIGLEPQAFHRRFRHEIGRSPKRLARVWRCGRAVAIVKKGGVIRMDDTFPARSQPPAPSEVLQWPMRISVTRQSARTPRPSEYPHPYLFNFGSE